MKFLIIISSNHFDVSINNPVTQFQAMKKFHKPINIVGGKWRVRDIYPYDPKRLIQSFKFFGHFPREKSLK